MERFRRRSSAGTTSNRLGQAVTSALRKISPARSEAHNRAGSPNEDPKGPLGLNLLNNVNDPQIDFIFVHGLGGGSRKTWSLSRDPRHYWPKEWLPRDPEFKSVRIHSFGYKADWTEMKESILNIHDFARSLLSEIHRSPDIRRSKTRIVLIAHSLGGIVIKKTYMLAREDPQMRELADRIDSLYFLATPHRGSDLATSLANILKISYGSKAFVAELDRSSESIEAINDSFRHFAKDVQLWSFYETVRSDLVFTNSIIVEKNSAILGYPEEKPAPLNADHRGVCKFDHSDDPNYQIIRKTFITTIDAILLEVSRRTVEVSQDQHRRLVELTGITAAPVDDLSALEEIRVSNSCRWLTSKESFKYWRTALSGSPSIFWLTGNGGSGKSVLSSAIINELQETEAKPKCSYFFFKYGDSTKSTTARCLQSLAYQMAMSDVTIMQRLLKIEEDPRSSAEMDERTIWRKWFLGCIFKEPDFAPRFWIIDALDECQRFAAFAALLDQIPSNLKIFLTSRNTPEMQRGMDRIFQYTKHYQISEEDVLDDCSRLVDSRIEHLPTGDHVNQQRLKREILARASGSLLWVSLVIKSLEETYSEEEAEKVLNEIPRDMNEIYARMIETIVSNTRVTVLARSLFMFTLFSLRPLKISELQVAIKLEADQTVYNLEKSIAAICGQLLLINRKGEVEVSHQTAKTYLLRQDRFPALTLNKQECHTRYAQICLKTLTGSLLRDWNSKSSKSTSSAGVFGSALLDYACEYFSDHLQKGSSEDLRTWDLLLAFLNSNVLLWIQYFGIKKNLRPITRSAVNLRAYMQRRIAHISPLSPQKGAMESWVNDLIRITAKFGNNITTSVSSIGSLIPAMCPSDSIVSKTYSSRNYGIIIKGPVDKSWDDCLARIDYPALQTSAIACGIRHSAVAVSNGTIYLYYQDSVHLKTTFDHGSRANILEFSDEDRYLASSGMRKINIWDVFAGTKAWSFDTEYHILTLLFAEDCSYLTAANQGGYLVTWDLEEGVKSAGWRWNDSIQRKTGQQTPDQQSGKALISPSSNILAVCYRGLPIYLFNAQTERFIGCCTTKSNPTTSTTSQYLVDALAFNPNSDINNLIVSYGDGELVIYDIESAELRYRSVDVFAHSLACSPDGRTLVTGSSSGTLQIFEFGGARGDSLSLLYRINAYEDGIRGIAFSSDSLRFADIRGSQYRIWEPAVLVCTDLNEDSQSGLSYPISLEAESVGMLEGPPEAEITTICHTSSGDFVFCGHQDGSVIYFETRNATRKKTLYQHASNVGITCMVYTNDRSLLITADESGRVLIYHLNLSNENTYGAGLVAEIRSKGSVEAILPDASATRILIRSRHSAEIWTVEGERVGSSMSFHDSHGNTTFINHPLITGHLVSISQKERHIYSWETAHEIQHATDEIAESSDIIITPPSPVFHRRSQSETLPKLHTASQFPLFVVNSSTSKSSLIALRIWSTASIANSSGFPQHLPLNSFDIHVHRIRQIIGVTGSLVLFIDQDLWVCSLDLMKITMVSHRAKRHFFLLTEWQTIDGDFIVDYSSARGEFLVARKHMLLVVSRGLEFEEPWFPM